MPRYANDDNSEIFRAIVTTTAKWPGQSDLVSTQTFGPYADRRAASAQITRTKNDAGSRNFHERFNADRLGIEPRFEHVVTGRVERTAVNWEEC